MNRTDFENMAKEGAQTLSGVFSNMADRLHEFAETVKPSDDELEEIEKLNAGKTAEEIKREDDLAAMMAAPIVKVLDGLSGIINSAAAELREKTQGGNTSSEVRDDNDN